MTVYRPSLLPLPAEAADAILDDAFRVLRRHGVLVENEETAALLAEAGAVRRDGRHCLDEPLVRRALATAPSRFALFDREGEPAVAMGEGRVHFDPGSAAIHLLDPATLERRAAGTDDVVALIRLVDALPHYAAQATALLASDVPVEAGDRYRLYLALRHGRKPVVTGTFRRDGFAPMRAMLAAVRQGQAGLAARPLAFFDCCPSPPLKWSDLTAQCLVDCARAGVPATLISMPLTGATAPVTLREALVQHCAESLSGVTIHQLAQPGAPIVWGGAPSAFDMRHGSTPMGAPETMLLVVGYASIGRRLGLPTHGYLALSDAKTPDYQAGLETGTGALLGALAGIDLVSGPGILDYILTQSLEKLLLDHEACGHALRLARGIDATEADIEALFGDLIEKGELLSHPHTRRHWRGELSVPSALIDRASWADWESGGRQSAWDRARSEVTRRGEAAGSPASPELARELDGIMRSELRRWGMDELPAAAVTEG